jgi:hypothetical protein
MKARIYIKQSKFLGISSIILKFYAWIVLISALLTAIAVGLGVVPSLPRWMGFLVFVAYVLIFFFLYTVALIADILGQLTEAMRNR